jgi:LysR family transcriptional regulator, regulator for bpeEF and oprC
MDRLFSMRIFTRVVEMSSFTRAAESMQLPVASASRLVQALESHLNVKLLNRTTSNVSVTEEGMTYYERCVGVLNEIDEMEALAAGAKRTPIGRIKVSLPASLAKHVMIPALPRFFADYPDIEIELSMSDRRIDLVEEGVDCAIRLGPVEEIAMVAKHIGEVSRITCASPAYLDRCGVPSLPTELTKHVAVNYVWNNGARIRQWEFMVDGVMETFPLKGMIAVNDADAYLACGLAGLGIISGSDYTVGPFVKSGALREILADYRAPPGPVSMIYHQSRHMPNKLRVFIDWFSEAFQASMHNVTRRNEG